MTINIEELKRDREAGTPGDWSVEDCHGDTMDACKWENGAFQVLSDVCQYHAVADVSCNSSCRLEDECEANARRIARLPDLEAAFLEAVEAIKSIAAGASVNLEDDLVQGWRKIAVDRIDMARNFLDRNT